MKRKIKLNLIRKNPENPRIIKDDSYKKLVNSLREFPEMIEIRSIVIDKNNMVWAGNQRLEAARELGWKETIVDQPNWNEDKLREFMIKDNLHSGYWDNDAISSNFSWDTLDHWDFKTPDIKFNKDLDLDFDPERTKTESEKNINKCNKCGLELK